MPVQVFGSFCITSHTQVVYRLTGAKAITDAVLTLQMSELVAIGLKPFFGYKSIHSPFHNFLTLYLISIAHFELEYQCLNSTFQKWKS